MAGKNGAGKKDEVVQVDQDGILFLVHATGHSFHKSELVPQVHGDCSCWRQRWHNVGC